MMTMTITMSMNITMTTTMIVIVYNITNININININVNININEVTNTPDNKTMQATSAVFLIIKENKSDANQVDDMLRAINLHNIIIAKMQCL